jgi:hypothetical protein
MISTTTLSVVSCQTSTFCGMEWADSVQKLWTLHFNFDKNYLWMDKKSRFWPLMKCKISNHVYACWKDRTFILKMLIAVWKRERGDCKRNYFLNKVNFRGGCFYLPHMEYERSIGFVSRNETFLLQIFTSPLNAKFVPRLESWNFGSQPHLGQLDVLHTQNLEIQVPKGSHLREVFWGYAV